MPTCGSRGISDGIYPVSRGDRRQNNEPGGGLFSGRVKYRPAASERGYSRVRAGWWGAKIPCVDSQRNPGPTIDVFSGDPGKPDIDSIWTSTGQNVDTDHAG